MRSFPGVAVRCAVLGAVVSATLLTAGCSQAAPGVVAYVGNDQITQSQVEAAVAGVSSTVQAGQTVSTDAVINAMIQGRLSEQIAQERHITITDAQRDSLLKTTNLAALVDVPAARPVAYDVADQQIVSQKLGAAPFLAEIAKRSVTLNPRYGVIDEKQKTIVTDQSGSLSTPAPSAAP